MFEISHEEMQQLKAFQLIDIREKEEREERHIGGEWIPMGTLLENPSVISSEMPVVLYCRSGGRSLVATKALRRLLERDDIYSLAGGIRA